MLCPKCGSVLRESKKSSDYLLCDECMKKIKIENAIPEEELEEEGRSHIGLIIVVAVFALLIVALVIVFVLYRNKNSESESASDTGGNKDISQDYVEKENSYTVDGITVSAETFSVEPYEDPEGKYSQRIAVKFTIQNDTDNAFGYINACDGRLSDGYVLEGWRDLQDMDLQQVPSHSVKDMTAYLLAEDFLELDEIEVTYNFLDYNEEYWDDLGKILIGEMEQDEYMNKYGNPVEMTFVVVPE